MEHSRPSLQKGLLPRHVQLMALGGMIGTGIFKGSAEAIHIAGPSVVLTYLIGGVLLFWIMAALAEMAIAYPGSNVQHLIRRAFGFRLSWIVGWLYWINWTLVTVVELLAAGSFLNYWVPSAPLWQLALLCACLIMGLNLFPVKYYGEAEFWLAGLKVAALVVFIVLGACVWAGVIPSRHKRLVSVCRRRRMVSARVCRNAQRLAYRDVFLWRSGADRGGGDGDERRRAGAAARHSHHNLAGCRLLSFANGHHLRHYAMEHRFGNEQPLCPSVGSDRVARRGPCHERGVAHCRLIGGQYRRLCDFSVAVHHG